MLAGMSIKAFCTQTVIRAQIYPVSLPEIYLLHTMPQILLLL